MTLEQAREIALRATEATEAGLRADREAEAREQLPDRNPANDPRPGDELAGNPWRYRVTWHEADRVTYELYNMGWGYVAAQSVSLAGWRGMAAGLIVEKTA